jgi:transcriptional regulator with XRE-family HTH domain
MNIGIKIKELRLQRDLTQEELAGRCELTKGYISQIENDLASPTIATLMDILSALGTNLSDFFDDTQEDDKIVFGQDDYVVKEEDGTTTTWLVRSSQKYSMEPIAVEIAPHTSTYNDNPHEGEEFGYVLSGTVKISLGKKVYTAKCGDSFLYKADKEHSLINDTDKPAKVLWVTSPPNF